MFSPDDESGAVTTNSSLEAVVEDEFNMNNACRKFIPLSHVYSATSTRKSSCKPLKIDGEERSESSKATQAHSHLGKRKTKEDQSLMETFLTGCPVKTDEELDEDCEKDERSSKMKKRGVDHNGSLGKNGCRSDGTRKKGDNSSGAISNGKMKKRKNGSLKNGVECSVGSLIKKWACLSFQGVNPLKFNGLRCKVYWPLDGAWYYGQVTDFDSGTGRHHVKYEDGEEENLMLSNERIKFHISFDEMQLKNLKVGGKNTEADGINVDEMMILAANLDGCNEIETGDVIWAKLSGYAIWPAIVLDESHVRDLRGLNKISAEKSVFVQFFGTHDFARVRHKQVMSFLKGLFSSYHLKCQKPTFQQGLEEAKMYLSEQRLPETMLQLRDGIKADMNCSRCEDPGSADTQNEECISDEEIRRKLDDLKSIPLEAGDLQIKTLGKIVEDSKHFQDEQDIWPEGYIAGRMFYSVTDPSVLSLYMMEVLRDVETSNKPLFKVTADHGEKFTGPTPSACWNKIYKRIKMVQTKNPDTVADRTYSSGSYMFGFSNPEVSKLIKEMTRSRSSFRSSQLSSKRTNHSSVGYRQVNIQWRDLDKCNVCHMDEEYENNLFLQCDKCRMMVHARCYGELEPTGGDLWLCNLCRPDAPESTPPCCLCPIIGGAMKPTTDGRWAHLACAIWIPETCLAEVKKMEPIDGLHRINKDRWRLLCSICYVPHGACIQCSNHNCRVAYHPLCARAAGFCLETKDMNGLHRIHFDEEEESHCIQLLSFCRKHRPHSHNEQLSLNMKIGPTASKHADYIPPLNPSGCARAEPYNVLLRRGRKEPEVLDASLKHLYKENFPYLLGGCSPHMPLWSVSSNKLADSKHYIDLEKLRFRQLHQSRKILSVADKYDYMRDTFRKRLAFGKSGIHGYGVFAKHPHRAGDMVIEYTGELIRPRVADRREHLIYNTMVGAGTYMFRIDDNRVIDATRAGSIAHLINHSCEPNCYSRVLSVNGEDHIIIFAKRDIKQWEELTYDYRFVSVDERLPCYCGASRCRGIVNDTEAEEQVAKLSVHISEVLDWQGE